jgi:hypothetical protein
LGSKRGGLDGGISTYTISGIVYDADGTTPVSGATVALGLLTATSGVDGTYTISNVPAGTSGSMTCTKGGYNWVAIAIAAMAANLTAQNYTANNYAAILRRVYSASEVWSLVDIASGTAIKAYVSAAHNGTLTGWLLQNSAGPVTNTLAPYSDGSGDYGNIGASSVIFNGAIGAAFVLAKVANAGVWTDGVARSLFDYKVDANNWLQIYKSSSNNIIQCYAALGGGAKIRNITVSTTDWFLIGMTWKDSANGNSVVAYLNTTPQTALTTFGAWSGVPTILTIGSIDTTPNQSWHGWLAYKAVKYGSVWTPTDITNIYNALAGAGPENP